MIKIIPMIYKIFKDLISYSLYKDIFKYINANKNPNTPSNGWIWINRDHNIKIKVTLKKLFFKEVDLEIFTFKVM